MKDYLELDCLKCNTKFCKTKKIDCTTDKNETIEKYNNFKDEYNNADKLISNGRAGKLSRLEEIKEFIILQNYKNIAIAYCFGIEEIAKKVKIYLEKNAKVKITSYRCTIQGIKENEIDENLTESVSCNPIGQAETINKTNADLVIEMGLCLGHDIMFHKYLKKAFTVFMVKDRVYNHNPQQFFNNNKK